MLFNLDFSLLLPFFSSPLVPLCNESFWPCCSIVFNNEYSARLSLRSVLQLRADAITALSEDSKTDTATIFRLARRCIFVSMYQRNKIGVMHRDSDVSVVTIKSENLNNHTCESRSPNDSKGSPILILIQYVVCSKMETIFNSWV